MILIVYFVTSLGFAPLVKSIFVYNLPIPEGSAYTDTWKFYDQLGDYAYSLTTYLKFKGDEINTESEDFIDYFINEGKGSQIADTYYEYASMRRLAEILAEIEKKPASQKTARPCPMRTLHSGFSASKAAMRKRSRKAKTMTTVSAPHPPPAVMLSFTPPPPSSIKSNTIPLPTKISPKA